MPNGQKPTGSSCCYLPEVQKPFKEDSELGSTQANESINNSIASKAPKRFHYSGSASLNYRVSAAVAQKNIGHTYVSKVDRYIDRYHNR